MVRKVPERVVERLGDQLAEGAARKAGKLSRRAERMSATATHLAEHAERLDRLAARLDTVELWTRNGPGARQPRFSREHLAETAVKIADAEGFDALSMRRLAAELGAGTMTLYHYVRTKDELLTLVSDHVMAEVVLPPSEPLPEGWRDAISAIAHRSRRALLRHRWILDITDGPGIGPNSVRHFDQTMQAAAGLGGTLEDQLDLVLAVDEYVFGFCLSERHHHADAHDVSAEREMIAYVEGLLRGGGYPKLAELAAEHGAAELWDRVHRHARTPDRFDRNLGRLLDGFERRAAG